MKAMQRICFVSIVLGILLGLSITSIIYILNTYKIGVSEHPSFLLMAGLSVLCIIIFYVFLRVFLKDKPAEELENKKTRRKRKK